MDQAAADNPQSSEEMLLLKCQATDQEESDQKSKSTDEPCSPAKNEESSGLEDRSASSEDYEPTPNEPTFKAGSVTCLECGFTAMTTDLVKRHIAASHISEVKTQLPPDLSKGHFSNLNINSSQGEPCYRVAKKPQRYRQLKCQQCEYSSRNLSDLKRHMSKHTKERYKCTFCKYTTTTAAWLVNHQIMNHSSQRPFKCQHCNYCGKHSSHLKRHIMYKHTRERCHKCDLCDYGATELSTLKRHFLNRHSSEVRKPYKCNHCDYCSKKLSHLKRHILGKHLKMRPFKCHHCCHCTTQLSALKSHIVKKHVKGCLKKGQ